MGVSERTRERTVTHTRYGIIYSPCPPRARRYSRDLLVRATSALLNTYLTEKSWVVPHMLQLDIYFKSRKGCILVWWSCAMLVMLYSMIEEHQSCLMHHSAWKKMPTVQRYNPLNQLIDLLTYWLIDLPAADIRVFVIKATYYAHPILHSIFCKGATPKKLSCGRWQ